MKILLVEDDPAIRLLIEKALSSYHTVEVAEDGRAALALAEQIDYDLLVLDIGIPEIDGISVCKRLRAQECQTPILLLTARDRMSDRVLGLDAGADDYMVKPFHMPELLARIRALCRRGSTTTAVSVTWEKLQLNDLTHEICYGEQRLHLTPKEYGILELLLLNPHKIFSRSTMIDRLWELEETPTESAISSHIKSIRQKLKAAGASHDFIETIYGFGYRLRPLKAEESAESNPEAVVLDAAPDFSQEAADAVMLDLWERFKESFSSQLDLMDQVVNALQESRLTIALHQEAKQTIHKLVGSLGVYGFPQGSVLARQIADLLHSPPPLEAAKIQQMAQWVAALRQETSKKPRRATPSTPIAPLPRVLIVDNDTALIEQLQAEAARRSFHLTSAPNLEAAQFLLDRDRPNVLLLDLTFADRHDEGLHWLATLKQQYPHMPMLVFTGRDNLSDRVTVARSGAQALLQKPMSVEKIFQTIQEVLQRRQPPTAKVMVVDDDPSILHRLSVVLSPWGLEVKTLLDPARFWEVLTHTAPDLLLLDIEMPGFNGIELCEVVRNDLQWGNLPILFLTAHQEVDMIVQAFAAGGDDYIRKPILEPELVARVLNRLEVRQRRRLGG
ncbi:MAG TPA: response regulator [Coleofasciculaceae cyanobacterium]